MRSKSICMTDPSDWIWKSRNLDIFLLHSIKTANDVRQNIYLSEDTCVNACKKYLQAYVFYLNLYIIVIYIINASSEKIYLSILYNWLDNSWDLVS
jgi:hypothetical protein